MTIKVKEVEGGLFIEGMTPDDFEELLNTSLWSEALNIVGVDNWGGYDYALKLYREMIGY